MGSTTKTTIKKLLGEGGAGMDASMGGAVAGLRDLFVAVVNGLKNRLINGGEVGDPTTPSAQAAGVGNTTWNVNVAAARVVVGGTQASLAAAADVAVHSGSLLMANGKSCVAAVVAKLASGTVSVVTVKGATATTGAQVAPTDAQIQAAVGAGVPWVKLAQTTLNRTADTVVTQSHDNAVADLGLELLVE